MNTLPLAAFPIAGKLNKSSGFAMALVLGLAFYLAARNSPQPGQKASSNSR